MSIYKLKTEEKEILNSNFWNSPTAIEKYVNAYAKIAETKNGLSHTSNYSVVIGEYHPSVNLTDKVIRLPYCIARTEKDLRQSIASRIVFLKHELGHVLYTMPEIARDLPKLELKLYGGIEDAKIELCLIRDFPGMESILKAGRYAQFKYEFQFDLRSFNLKNFGFYCIFKNYNYKGLVNVHPKIIELYNKYFNKYVNAKNDSTETRMILRDIIEEYVEIVKTMTSYTIKENVIVEEDNEALDVLMDIIGQSTRTYDIDEDDEDNDIDEDDEDNDIDEDDEDNDIDEDDEDNDIDEDDIYEEENEINEKDIIDEDEAAELPQKDIDDIENEELEREVKINKIEKEIEDILDVINIDKEKVNKKETQNDSIENVEEKEKSFEEHIEEDLKDTGTDIVSAKTFDKKLSAAKWDFDIALNSLIEAKFDVNIKMPLLLDAKVLIKSKIRSGNSDIVEKQNVPLRDVYADFVNALKPIISETVNHFNRKFNVKFKNREFSNKLEGVFDNNNIMEVFTSHDPRCFKEIKKSKALENDIFYLIDFSGSMDYNQRVASIVNALIAYEASKRIKHMNIFIGFFGTDIDSNFDVKSKAIIYKPFGEINYTQPTIGILKDINERPSFEIENVFALLLAQYQVVRNNDNELKINHCDRGMYGVSLKFIDGGTPEIECVTGIVKRYDDRNSTKTLFIQHDGNYSSTNSFGLSQGFQSQLYHSTFGRILGTDKTITLDKTDKKALEIEIKVIRYFNETDLILKNQNYLDIRFDKAGKEFINNSMKAMQIILNNYKSDNFKFDCNDFEISIDNEMIKLDRKTDNSKKFINKKNAYKKMQNVRHELFDNANTVGYRRMLDVFSKKRNWKIAGFGLDCKQGASYISNFAYINVENMFKVYVQKMKEII